MNPDKSINRPFVRNSLVMVICGLGLLLAIISSAVVLIDRTRNSFDKLVAERTVRSTVADLFSLLQDAETGQRGYLLTLNPDFLEPYNAAVAQIPALEAKLEEFLSANHVHSGDPSPLFKIIDSKLREMATTVELAKAGKSEEAKKIVQDGFGQRVMEKIRDQMQTIIDVSDNNIQDNIDQQLQGSTRLKWIIIGAGAAIVTVLGGAIYIIMRHIRSLSAARREVLQLNDELEERVEERTQDLMRANQEIQRYAYIVTHDLRAPLVNIMGFSSELEMSLKQIQAYVLADGQSVNEQEILDAREAAATDVPEALAFIRSSTAKMDGLINAILKISRDGRRQLKPERLDIRSIIKNSATSLQHLVDEADGEVRILCPPLLAVSDRLSLEQIFTNLIDNAVKYRNKTRPLKITVTGARRGRMLEIDVMDNGRGIDTTDLERVFELFRRAGPQDQVGEGIGLAHVRSMARNLGGDITVRSTPKEGSTFTLKVPADLSQALRSNIHEGKRQGSNDRDDRG